jgi:hypothetical protein
MDPNEFWQRAFEAFMPRFERFLVVVAVLAVTVAAALLW